MADFPGEVFPVPAVLTPFSEEAYGMGLGSLNFLGIASTAWPGVNVILYYPFKLADYGLAQQLMFYVGATQNGNVDVGIYDSQGNKIVSAGSTAMAAANSLQLFDITDTWLPPGEYLLAVWCSSATGTCRIATQTDEILLARVAVYTETAASLPAVATPTLTSAASPAIAAVGIAFRPLV